MGSAIKGRVKRKNTSPCEKVSFFAWLIKGDGSIFPHQGFYCFLLYPYDSSFEQTAEQVEVDCYLLFVIGY